MRRFFFLIAVLIGANNLGAANIIELIRLGNSAEAREEMARLASASRRDGLLLVAQAMLEPDGRRSRLLMDAASQAGIPPEYAEDFHQMKVSLFFAEGDYGELRKSVDEYFATWEAGKYREQMMFLRAIALEKIGDGEEAEKMKEQILKEGSSSHLTNQIRLSQSARLLERKKFTEAQKSCRRIINSRDEELSAAAMYLLASSAIELGRADDAIHYYNLLKESYPRAVGLEDLADRFERFEKHSADQKAEKLTGTIYSLQTGVFAQKENADVLAARMKKYRAQVEIDGKTISGRKYYVVYVGRFQSADRAMEFKAKLEEAEKESYQVVAR
jgi:tetratricopeptide (TPR) repeat protein